jgi:adenylate cyclase
MLGRGLVEPVTATVTWLLAALATLMWFGRNGWLKLLVLAASAAMVLGGSAMALWHGFYVHTGTLLAVGVLAFLARLGWESMSHYQERQLLRTAFAGHVSSQVMRAILGGRLQPDGDGARSKVTILFADIRDFTTRSDKSTPEAMIALLNRYYAEVSAAIQGRGGAVDKLIGDGLTATFGVPLPLPSPERNALEAAQGILVRVVRLNAELKAEGLAPLEIGIGIHSGEVLAGYVGSLRRRDFTVIGNPVEVASRLEGMSRTLGYPVVCSNEIAAAVGFKGGLVDLGAQPIMGQPDAHVWGWNPPLVGRLEKGFT